MLLTRHDLKEMNEAINKIENRVMKEADIDVEKEIELIKYKLRKAIGVE